MQRVNVLSSYAVTTALTNEIPDESLQMLPNGTAQVLVECNFTYGSGGTDAEVVLQTTIDGTNWIEIADFNFTTSDARLLYNLSAFTAIAQYDATTDLTDNTSKAGVIGDRVRAKVTTTGTYADSTTIDLTIIAR